MAGEHQVLEALYRAYNGHDADAAASLYTAGGHHEDVATQRVQRSPEAIAVGLRGFLDAFPDAHWRCLGVASDHGVVFGQYVLTGTLQGALGGLPAHGQRLELRGVHVLRTRDGQIEQSEDYWDLATFQRQMKTATEQQGDSQ
ncbi:ester cyclase [Nocardioides nitrophenolicus]|uniref:ester cyclase n=1 Tax=Nocardioides nitrophenolicus TaxID=60489 RepID=UPI0019569710|nr:ester cyclase [Nocardioides nitrophenolicus]MBM7518624.1 steroid delta-isomerase-like uncharacterized protein [Nocardioides nitrophenolicus]